MRHRPLATLAGVLAAGLLAAACGGTAGAVTDTPPAADPATAAPATEPETGSPAEPETATGIPAEAPSPAPPASPADDAPADGDAAPDGEAPADGAFEVQPEGQELVLVHGDQLEIIATLDPAGESFFRAAAVRPGSTASDLTVVALTQAEGMYDLRWLRVVDGRPGPLTVFPAHHNVSTDLLARQELVPTPVWSPDGASIAWVEAADGHATLRTVGWDDGPGTGRPADDNAAFGLAVDGVPSELQAVAWDVLHSDGSQTILRLADADGREFGAHLERQADGALALHDVEPLH